MGFKKQFHVRRPRSESWPVPSGGFGISRMARERARASQDQDAFAVRLARLKFMAVPPAEIPRAARQAQVEKRRLFPGVVCCSCHEPTTRRDYPVPRRLLPALPVAEQVRTNRHVSFMPWSPDATDRRALPICHTRAYAAYTYGSGRPAVSSSQAHACRCQPAGRLSLVGLGCMQDGPWISTHSYSYPRTTVWSAGCKQSTSASLALSLLYSPFPFVLIFLRLVEAYSARVLCRKTKKKKDADRSREHTSKKNVGCDRPRPPRLHYAR